MKRNLFGNRLKKARIRKGYTQLDLCFKTKIQPSTISVYERGLYIPSADNLKKLSKVLNISTGYLLGKK